MESLIVVVKVFMALFAGIACGSMLAFLTDIQFKNVVKATPCIAYAVLMIALYQSHCFGVIHLEEILTNTWYNVTITGMATIAWFFGAMYYNLLQTKEPVAE